MPKIVRIINRLNLGGPTLNVALLTKYLSPEFETILLAGSHAEGEESSEYICRQMGVEFISVPEMSRELSWTKDRKAYRKIKNIIGDYKPDIVHTHAAKAGALGRMAAFSLKVPVVVHTFHGHIFHSYFNPVKSRLFLAIERHLAARSSAIVAISDFQRDELLNRFQLCEAKKIRVIPLGFDLTRFHEGMEEKRKVFRQKYLVDDDEVAICIIGRLVPVKNHALFMEALNLLLSKSTRKVRAFVVGDGELREQLEKTATEIGIKSAYLPYIETEQIPAHNKSTLTFVSWMKEAEYAVAGADIIALSSDNEGTPVSLIEAQAAQKPIVSTNVGGIENVVLRNETALLCQPGDAEMFARHLLMLLENDTIRQTMSAKGWEHVKDKFHYTRLVKDVKVLYRELLDKRKGNTNTHG